MLLVVTTIGMLVHVYCIGYMAHDPGRWRFFAYLNLFMFSMLLLVVAGQLPAGLRGLGAGGPVELPAHRLLVLEPQRSPCQQEGVPDQPGRRLSGSRWASWPSGPRSGTLNYTEVFHAAARDAPASATSSRG